ncbi:MAG: hypothetical protein WDW38_000434 [Sanguina aurantia]
MILRPALLTSSGRPILQAGEVERTTLEKVDLEFCPSGGIHGQLAADYKDGYVIVTNQRLVWLDGISSPAPGRSCHIPIHAIQRLRRKTTIGFSPKLWIVLDVFATATGTPSVAALEPYSCVKQLLLRCHTKVPDTFNAYIDEALQQRPPPGLALHLTSSTSAPNLATAATDSTTPSPTSTSHLHQRAPTPANGVSCYTGVGTNPGPTPVVPQGRARASSAASGSTSGIATAGRRMGRPTGSDAGGQAVPDALLLRQMTDMGFPYNRSARALLATANAGVQQAMDHLLAFGDSPGMDEPLSPTPRTSPPPSTSPPLSQPDRHGLPPSTPREGRTAVRMFPSNNSNPNLNTSSMTNSYASQSSNTQNHSNPRPSSSYSVPSTSSTAYYPGSPIPHTSQPGLPFPHKNPYEGQSSAQNSTSSSVNAYAAEYSPYGSANPPPPSYPVTPGSGRNSSVVRLVNPLHALSDSLQGLGLSGRNGGGGGSESGSSGGGGPSERPNVFGGGYSGSGGSSAFSTVGVAGLVRREEAKTSDAGR